ncbi:hypothetical protein Cgig2_028065 [Carnegiea gigantea]|uniref:DOG1 domain-containing protein n=1 Tax=Carnegiea gigantea TaxID=171969 RepID=A0A9Q1JEZ8_9CARY|nr:hypothetical protein Cgig2_028065 [Carnegiea gigantea]
MNLKLKLLLLLLRHFELTNIAKYICEKLSLERVLLCQKQEGISKSKEESSTDESGSALNTLSSSSRPDEHDHAHDGDDQGHFLEPETSDPFASTYHHHHHHHHHNQQQPGVVMASNITKTEAASQNPSPSAQPHHKCVVGTKSDKVLDAKAYVQQLESSRMKLAQLELDLQRTRSQGVFFGGAAGAPANISSGGATFDMEYGRWVEDDQRLMGQLRAALQSHLSEAELGVIVDGYINHYDEIFRLKGAAAKSDVFHLLTGVWTSPAERCFLWIAGFRPSELIKMLIGQLEPLTEQQLMVIYSLQQSCLQAEEALSQGLDRLQQSLVETISITTNNVTMDPMHQMALSADNLRQQTLHQLRRIFTVRQAVKCFLMIGEYYGRLRALSSLWASCPRDQ